MSKTSEGPFFEDFELGQTIRCPVPRRLGDGEVAAYIALCGDRTPRFCGAERLLHPLIVFHTVIGQTVRDVSLNARANLGYAEMRWARPVAVGAVLRTEAEVIGLKENSSGKHGIVWVRTRGRDSEGELLSFVRWVMVHKRDPSRATRWAEAPSVPQLAEAVSAADLSLPKGPLPTAADTGGRYVLEDYAVGERVLHGDGATITPSSHMDFTRLFQNTARVHFDGTRGEPLVYGGYVMSLGYAQAYHGFENRLGVVAINGGVHANPVHAGDTLFSFSDVLETDDLGDGPVGALRLRLVVVKNTTPTSETSITIDGRHPRDVVLDLDLWELMPKGKR